MKVVIAMDSFKGSMTSMEAGGAAKAGVLAVMPEAEVIVRPLADGGEGTMEALCTGLGGEIIEVCVSDPLGRKIMAKYAEIMSKTGGKTAIIEMAQASGLTLLTEEERNPYKTTTYGVGEMICDALSRGCREFIIGIGGSATNDGGMGMLRALGYRFFDANGIQIPEDVRGVQALLDVRNICEKQVKKELKECTFRVACDVTNPLCGKNGATYVYAPQKGLAPEDCEKVDKAMGAYANAVMQLADGDCRDFPGAGAAGGLGFAFVSMLGATMIPGAELVMQATELSECMKDADIFLTGEGRIDGQTAMGKAPMLAAQTAKRVNPECRVYALAGQVKEKLQPDGTEKTMDGFDRICVITPAGMSMEQAMQTETARENMRRTVCELIGKSVLGAVGSPALCDVEKYRMI